ncbi:MAG: hypothetical protein D6778_06430 [Nitrospirae bacterium]|nr:MAG: hypothetical protein D6778_06430 [Nitrospirota bacterium]
MDKVQIGIDYSIASEELIKILLDFPPDEGIYKELYEANTHRPEVLKLLYKHPLTPEDVRAKTAEALSLPALQQDEILKEREVFFSEEAQQARAKGLLQQIQRLNVGERVRLAMRANREVRNILIRDSHKEVVMKVLENPKVTESEIELAAKNPQLPEEALRFIAKKREWMRKYPIMVALVSNPKTPPGISMQYIGNLRTPDLIALSQSKNIPEMVRNAARRHLALRRK